MTEPTDGDFDRGWGADAYDRWKRARDKAPNILRAMSEPRTREDLFLAGYACGAAEERARIVGWLRRAGCSFAALSRDWSAAWSAAFNDAADAIESEEHALRSTRAHLEGE